ncbi:MAG: metal-dependent transcriptional regulator [Anaerolineales bacterium]|nr:metal-dependent transcriptional regulator [Anaerolineales bacterium]
MIDHPLLFIFLGLLPALALLSLFWPNGGVIRLWRCRRRSLKILVEDALKVILTAEMEGRTLDQDGLTEALGCRENKFSEVMDFLLANNLVIRQGLPVSLSENGREYATFILQAHRLYERYLAERTGYEEQEWHERAEWVEHHLTEDDVRSLAAELHFPSRDPHGDPIPTPAGTISSASWIALPDVEPGTLVKVEHIEDQPIGAYKALIDEGYYPGMLLKILDRDEKQLLLEAAGTRKRLNIKLAVQLSVEPAVEAGMPLEEAGEALSQLQPGEEAIVLRLMPQLRSVERRRLMDFGLLPGTTVQMEIRSPGGDPTAYRIRGSLLALRESQAKYIRVSPIGKEASHGS